MSGIDELKTINYFVTDTDVGNDCMDAGGRATHGAVAEEREQERQALLIQKLIRGSLTKPQPWHRHG